MKCLEFLKKILTKKEGKEQQVVNSLEDLNISEREDFVKQMKLGPGLSNNLQKITDIFGNSFDLNIRKIKIGTQQIDAALVFLVGVSDPVAVEKILRDLQISLLELQLNDEADVLIETITRQALNNKTVVVSAQFSEILKKTTTGSAALFIEGYSRAIICETRGYETRNIQEPEAEISIRGPRDGFVENIFTNSSLLRQRIRIPHLWLQKFEMGSLTKINVAIAYIKGLASEELIDEVKSRIERIDVDSILESGYIQEYISDEAMSVFPLIKRTERPDKVVFALLEGKVAILTGGTPFVLILPATFEDFLKAPDDYYETFPIGSFIRLLRYIAYPISIFLPGIYVGIIEFHPELIPIDLLLRIAATREGVPFPVIVEAFLMAFLFEVLREAGIRLPKAIGSAISIVGALILGEAAIDAGLASPPMIVIVALTAIASFTTPDFAFGIAARILRFVFLFLGGSIGLFGIQFGILILLIHLCALRSFGQPYFQPFGPLVLQDMKDSIARFPWWSLIFRSKLVGGREPQRQKKGQKPRPPVKRKGE